MGIISSIRERSGVAVIVIALAMIFFMIGSDIFGTGGMFSSQDTSIGEIAGQKVLAEDFKKKVADQLANMQAQSGKAPTDQEQAQVRQQVWEQYINDIAYQKEYDALGIKVSDDELVDMVQGKNIHPFIRQQFVNQATGQFDKNQVISYLKSLKTRPAAEQVQWANFEKGLMASRVRSKYEGMLSMSNYVTTLEAQRDYTAQTEKTNAKYIFVPFSSIADSTIKISDEQLTSYMNEHKDRYKGVNARSMEYVMFPLIATKEDTASFYDKIRELSKGLGAATNDSSFAAANSDIPYPASISPANLPESVRGSLGTFNAGGVYGPFKDGENYAIVKYKGTSRDSLMTVRASHILVPFATKTDSAKAVAKVKAQALLSQIKSGGDFASIARANAGDGSAQKGGDLGFFKNNGGMVKPFEQAVFGFNGTGLLPNLVETDFGYHIIKVTEPKTNMMYRISIISKALTAGQRTRDDLYAKAEKFASENKTVDAFKAAAKKQNIISLTANRIMQGAKDINGMPGCAEAVQWAFNDKTEVKDISNAYEINGNYFIGILTGKSSKEKPSLEDYKDEIKYRLAREEKAKTIAKKLGGISGSLEQIAQKYGAGAVFETSENVTLLNGTLKSAGSDGVAIGKAFGLKPGQKSAVVKGDAGMYILEGTPLIKAPAIADYGIYKTQALQMAQNMGRYAVGEAIKDKAKINENIAKFY